MKRSLNGIEPVLTSHNAGLKRVLLSANESECPITQIAVTDLKRARQQRAMCTQICRKLSMWLVAKWI